MRRKYAPYRGFWRAGHICPVGTILKGFVTGLKSGDRSFTLRVDISEAVIHDYQTYYKDQTNTVTRLVASTDAVECAKALVTLLNATAMQGLGSLTVEAHPIFDSTFVAAIFNHHLAPPSVRLDLSHITSLSTSTCCTVLAAVCPSVTRLELAVCHDDDTGITEEEAVIWGAQTKVLYLTVSSKRVRPKLDRIQSASSLRFTGRCL